MAPSIASRLSSFVSGTKNMLRPANASEASKNNMLDMIWHNWYLGFTAFGGPAVHFQIFRRLFVERYHWIDEQTYQELLALCQALPGPGSTKMLYGLNTIHYGFCPGVLSFFIWSLPMAVAAFGLALGVSNIGSELPGPVYALLTGLNSATVGIIALAAYQLAQKAITDPLTRILVFFGATAGMLYNALWYFPILMIAGGITTLVCDTNMLQKFVNAIFDRNAARDVEASPPPEVPVINISPAQPQSNTDNIMTARHNGQPSESKSPDQTASTSASLKDPPTPIQPSPESSHWLQSWKISIAIIIAFFITFTTVMILRGTLTGHSRGFDLFANLYLAGTIIFGGGPVVIPLLRSYVVAQGWVSARDFLLGLAICQAFPGPNFNFAVFLGTLAVQGSGVSPVVGALAAYFGIFAPGLILHLGTMGLWKTLRRQVVVKATLRGVHAAAVGLVYTAVYRLFEIGNVNADFQGGTSLGSDAWWIVIIATSFVGGLNFRLSPPGAIILGALMGLIWYGVNKSEGNVSGSNQ